MTNYLDTRSVAAVFNFFARDAGLGSRIIFTYVHAGLLNSSFAAPGVFRLTATLRAYGEPWMFGFQHEEVPAYLAEKGIRLLIDLGAAEYRGKYMGPVLKLIGYEFYRAALAEKVGHAAPRPERKEERRAQIVAAARTCFARSGFRKPT